MQTFTLYLFTRMKKFTLYCLRWQLSTPILAPVLIYCNGLFSPDKNVDFVIATAIANFIGASIFYWVDRFIFKMKVRRPLWEIKDDCTCDICRTHGRCYRLVRTGNYDRLNNFPVFLCEKCSKQKTEQLKARGVQLQENE